MNRGRRAEEIFTERSDYELFLELLKETSELFNVKVAAYCMMPNHYHLLLHTPDGNLSRYMRQIDGIYTQRFNRAHKYDGQLFRGRYKSILVEADSYVLELIRYIHMNPLRAGLSLDLKGYEWSSHKGYISDAKKWEWLYKGFALSLLTEDPKDRRRAYNRFIIDEGDDEISTILQKKKLPSILGKEDFVYWVRNRFFEKKFHIEPRSVAIYLTRMIRRDGLIDICKNYNLKKYSSASSVVEGVKKRLSKDRTFRKRVKDLSEKLIIGQPET